MKGSRLHGNIDHHFPSIFVIDPLPIISLFIECIKIRSVYITKKRFCHVQLVSAKHGVMDDFAFLWEHAIFRHPPNKNPLTDRSEILHN
jgi:hypothetical protein